MYRPAAWHGWHDAGAEEWKESSKDDIEMGMGMGTGAMKLALAKQDSGFDADGREQDLGQFDLEAGSGRFRKVVYVGLVEGYDRKTEKHTVRVSNRTEIGRAAVSQISPTIL